MWASVEWLVGGRGSPAHKRERVKWQPCVYTVTETMNNSVCYVPRFVH